MACAELITTKMNFVNISKSIEIRDSYDVIVCGGGVAGCAAAYSASKRGCKTLLIEKSCMLGGLATLGLINYFVPMCNGRGRQIIFGLCEKWLRMSAELGYDNIPAVWKRGEPEAPVGIRYTQRFSYGIFALQLLAELKDVNVDVLYDCTVTDAITVGNRTTHVAVATKGGTVAYSAKVFIDATGDCDLIRAIGAPHENGQNYFSYFAKGITLEGCKKAYESGNISAAYSSMSGGNINLFGKNQPQDVPRWAGVTPEDVNDYLQRNQLLLLSKLKAPEHYQRDIVSLPGMPQFRTTCHLIGEHIFTTDDAYRHFDDSIGLINDFERADYVYEVRYGTLYNKDYPNLLAAGRCASASGYGWDVLRVIPPAIITGQAAGEAAALANEQNCDLSDVDIKKLQSRLLEADVLIHFDEDMLPISDAGELPNENSEHF